MSGSDTDHIGPVPRRANGCPVTAVERSETDAMTACSEEPPSSAREGAMTAPETGFDLVSSMPEASSARLKPSSRPNEP